MYSKQEASQLRQQFWTALGQYMSPVPSFEGEKINWINYKTGVKYVALKMSAEGQTAEISINLSHPSLQVQKEVFDQLFLFKHLLHSPVGDKWLWQLHVTNQDGKTNSRIWGTTTGFRILNRNDWPGLISFFKPRLMALDAFWNQVKPAFE